MPFLQRNLFYLRASRRVVLQTILYIDPSNLRWMNSSLQEGDEQDVDLTQEDDDDDEDGAYGRNRRGAGPSTGENVWALALSHLREKIMPKLHREKAEGGPLASSNQKGATDHHIDVDFYMAYFLSATTAKHTVLLKDKELIFPAAKTEMPPPMIPASAMRGGDGSTNLRPSRLAMQRQALQEEDDTMDTSAQEGQEAQRNHRKRSRQGTSPFGYVKQEEDVDNIVLHDEEEPLPEEDRPAIEADTNPIDQTQDDKKPRIQVKYAGFQIFEKTLIVVIEPSKRAKRLRPSLFGAVKKRETHQLSATPLPDALERDSTQRADSRARSARLFRTTRSESLLSDFGDNDDSTGRSQRADSRQRSTQQAASTGGLFRGTPSEWEPTPSPSPAPPDLTSRGAAHRADEDERGDDSEDPYVSQSFLLASQLMETDAPTLHTNDLDED